MRVLVLDTETGGLDPNVESILTLGMCVLEGDDIIDGTLIKIVEPEINAHPRALAVNGINLDEHRRTGVSPAQAVEQIREFVRGWGFGRSIVPAGHNVPFDLGFIRRLFRIAGADYSSVFSHRSIDTMAVAGTLALAGRLYGQPNIGLDALCKRFGITIRSGTTHDALEDARATARLLVRLVAMVKNPNLEAPATQLTVPFEDTQG